MLAIKLKRIGKKHQAAFRCIVDEKRHKVHGRNIEDLGWWNPRSDTYELKKDRAFYWLGVGAKPTDTVYNLFVTAGVLSGKKRPVHKKPKTTIAEAPKASVEATKETTAATEPTKIEGTPAGETKS